MTGAERRASVGLASIFGLRMLGLFFILPVFTLYAGELRGATPVLIGLAVGAYGLTQALLQIPMGMLSDRIGRRPVIVGGLAVFALGSAVAALSGSIHGVILGRALQGGGAIAAAIMALAADVTRDGQRTKIMAAIGMSVGFAFLIALTTAPVVAFHTGLAGIFWLTAALALLAMALLYLLVPAGGMRSHERDIRPGMLRRVLRDPNLVRLDLGIMALHCILTAGFVVLPVVIADRLGLTHAGHWKVYVPVMLVSALALFPAIRLGERHNAMHRLVALMVAVLAVGEVALVDALHIGGWAVVAALLIYFTAFNVLEASLPSLVSRFAPTQAKGAALGVFSTCQFIGAFLGGLFGGALYGWFGAEGVFAFCAVLAGAWFVGALGLRSPQGDETAEAGYPSA